jgi:D-alanyl-D-alanine dipeptidase
MGKVIVLKAQSMQDNLNTKRILTYDDLAQVSAGNSSEALASVQAYAPSVVAQYDKPDMISYTGQTILVRDTVARKLAAVNSKLESEFGLRLKVVYGYRHPDVQQRYFDVRKSELRQESPSLAEGALDRLTHDFVAVPDVAGHPTGGAVDLTLIGQDGKEIDMGTAIADYDDPEAIKTFVAATDSQAANRRLLHDAMIMQGFAPFYGEWWHFSYGDREWAAFYGKKEALYGAVKVQL